MHVFSALFQLHLPSTSLKGKRGIVKSVLARARNGFNVAAAEVELQDMPGNAVLAFVTVGENKAQARRLLERLDKLDVRPGASMSVTAANGQTLTLQVNGRSIQIERPVAGRVWVRPITSSTSR